MPFFFELTVPFELRITEAHKLKTEKYSHFEKDITEYTTKIIALEIGSRGHVTSENKDRLKLLYNFTTKDLKFKSFVKSVSAISVLASYYIFISRKEAEFNANTPYIRSPFSQ